jgi:hypothetical protein
MKFYLSLVGLILALGAIFGLAGPWLFSAKSDEMFACGLLVLVMGLSLIGWLTKNIILGFPSMFRKVTKVGEDFRKEMDKNFSVSTTETEDTKKREGEEK